ncbi:MAG: DNA cytosine methyltransferase, partial [Armatimonadota bacterium]|nr:DNA cytosine methyltransferase [Armatimonadota bacterium]
DWGAQQAGVEIIWANDIDPHAATAYQAAFSKVKFVEGDIGHIKRFPQADVLIGCYPCTGFSLGSRRRWHLEEERNLQGIKGNFLYREFLRATTQVQPRYLFVENVKGMLTADGGWFFEEQIKSFKSLGYRIQFARLNACQYGVPQTRERVFIVGIRRDIKSFIYKFTEPTHALPQDITIAVERRKKKRYRSKVNWSRLASRTGELPLTNLLSPFKTLRQAIQVKSWPDDEYFGYKFHGHYLTRNRKRGWDELSFTIVANKHHIPLHPSGAPMRYVGKDKWELQGEINRRLSWRECAAIQELPEAAVPSGTLEDKYRVIGNAVPPAFGRILLEPIVGFESSL